MRRLAPFAAFGVLLLVGCTAGVPGGSVVRPVADTVVGPLPKPPTLKADPVAGKAVFLSAGCSACHTFTPAGSSSKVGPDLDHLPAFAAAANQGPLPVFVNTSIVDPNAYIAPGFQAGVMPPNYGSTLKPQQILDLVAFLTQKS